MESESSATLKSIREVLAQWSAQATSVVSMFTTERGSVDFLNTDTHRVHIISNAAVLSCWSRPFMDGARSDKLLASILRSFKESKAPRGLPGWSSDPQQAPNLFETGRIACALRDSDHDDLVASDVEPFLTHYITEYRAFDLGPHQLQDPSHPFLLFIAARGLSPTTRTEHSEVIASAAFSQMAIQLASKTTEARVGSEMGKLAWAVAALLDSSPPMAPALLRRGTDALIESFHDAGWQIWDSQLRIGRDTLTPSFVEALTVILVHQSGAWILRHAEALRSVVEWLDAQRIQTHPNPWVTPGGDIALWYNLQALELGATLEQKCLEALSYAALKRVRVPSSSPVIPWKHLVDTGFKEVLEDRVIRPAQAHQRGPRSFILFGPPGTSKSTIVRSLASEIGWPCVELGAADFCMDGFELLLRHTKEIFQTLFDLRETVVLFDEIDELVTAREQEQEKVGRFITTAMLPWFQKLRDLGQIVFAVNTNHIARYDSAISRPGRFDLIIPVGPVAADAAAAFLATRLHTEPEKAQDFLKSSPDLWTVAELIALADALDSLPKDSWTTSAADLVAERRPVVREDDMRTFEEESREFGRR